MEARSLAAVGSVPCAGSWTPVWCPDPASPPDAPAEILDNLTTVAAEILYNLTAQRFGQCSVTLRPCRRECADTTVFADRAGPTVELRDGAWYNLACGTCPAGGCACSRLSEALLPGPVDVTEVKLDGLVLTPGVDYRVDDHRILVRLGGEVWPSCQDMDLDDTEIGTWSVTGLYGEPLPMTGRVALGELATELIRACTGQSCALPRQVQSVARQGVDMTFVDLSGLLDAGRTGLTRVDQFIAAFNPHGLRSRPQVYDVDGPAVRRVGT